MLKYKPKQFWRLLKPTPTPNAHVPTAAFTEFNQKIFFDSSIQEEQYTPIVNK